MLSRWFLFEKFRLCFFFHKEIRRTNKTEIIDGLHYSNKKLSIPGDIIIYAPEEDLDLKMK